MFIFFTSGDKLLFAIDEDYKITAVIPARATSSLPLESDMSYLEGTAFPQQPTNEICDQLVTGLEYVPAVDEINFSNGGMKFHGWFCGLGEVGKGNYWNNNFNQGEATAGVTYIRQPYVDYRECPVCTTGLDHPHIGTVPADPFGQCATSPLHPHA
jgi:hypothetical protein